jgi:hypothetical protein
VIARGWTIYRAGVKRERASVLDQGMRSLVLLLAACTAAPDLETDSAALLGCPKSDCGTNTTVVDGVYFSKLHLFGDANDEGVSLLGYAWLPPGATRLDVRTNRLVAVNNANAIKAEHQYLEGIQFHLGVNNKVYRVRIAEVQQVQQYWAAPDNVPLETYRFEYMQEWPVPSNTPEPMCEADPLSPATLALDALVFEGDVYDAATKDIDIDPPAGWFNIACLGGAPAKMHLMRHTYASSDPQNEIETDEAMREALLLAWTGSYCGDGRPFTFPGQPLRVRDATGWLALTSNRSWDTRKELHSYDAVWNEHGAVCVDVPRLADSEPGVLLDILEHCKKVGHPITRCSQQPWFPHDWALHGHVFTANPLGS